MNMPFLLTIFFISPYSYVSQYSFSEPATLLMMGIIDLHHTIFFYLIMVFILVFWLMLYLMYQVTGKNNNLNYFNHCSYLEIAWTLLPSCIIGAILFPSLSLLHSSDELIDPDMTLKVIGHQWYWSYEYSDYNLIDPSSELGFDSYIKSNWINLLSDPVLVLPVRTNIRFLITSEDVLHSWAVPSWGVKMDAVPGRLNQVIVSLFKSGVYYGQCSEICGIGHGFMPITIEVVPVSYYLQWLYVQNPSSIDFGYIPYSSSGMHESVFISYLAVLDSGNFQSLPFFNYDENIVIEDFDETDLQSFLMFQLICDRLYVQPTLAQFVEHQLVLNYLLLVAADDDLDSVSSAESGVLETSSFFLGKKSSNEDSFNSSAAPSSAKTLARCVDDAFLINFGFLLEMDRSARILFLKELTSVNVKNLLVESPDANGELCAISLPVQKIMTTLLDTQISVLSGYEKLLDAQQVFLNLVKNLFFTAAVYDVGFLDTSVLKEIVNDLKALEKADLGSSSVSDLARFKQYQQWCSLQKSELLFARDVVVTTDIINLELILKSYEIHSASQFVSDSLLSNLELLLKDRKPFAKISEDDIDIHKDLIDSIQQCFIAITDLQHVDRFTSFSLDQYFETERSLNSMIVGEQSSIQIKGEDMSGGSEPVELGDFSSYESLDSSLIPLSAGITDSSFNFFSKVMKELRHSGNGSTDSFELGDFSSSESLNSFITALLEKNLSGKVEMTDHNTISDIHELPIDGRPESVSDIPLQKFLADLADRQEVLVSRYGELDMLQQLLHRIVRTLRLLVVYQYMGCLDIALLTSFLEDLKMLEKAELDSLNDSLIRMFGDNAYWSYMLKPKFNFLQEVALTILYVNMELFYTTQELQSVREFASDSLLSNLEELLLQNKTCCVKTSADNKALCNDLLAFFLRCREAEDRLVQVERHFKIVINRVLSKGGDKSC